MKISTLSILPCGHTYSTQSSNSNQIDKATINNVGTIYHGDGWESIDGYSKVIMTRLDWSYYELNSLQRRSTLNLINSVLTAYQTNEMRNFG